MRAYKIVSKLSTELPNLLQLGLIGWYIILSWSVLCTNWIAAVNVKVVVKVQHYC